MSHPLPNETTYSLESVYCFFFFSYRCFFNVTRQEAERMLEANPEYGSMILRPSSLANSYALTIRQVTPRCDNVSQPLTTDYRIMHAFIFRRHFSSLSLGFSSCPPRFPGSHAFITQILFKSFFFYISIIMLLLVI